MSREDYLKKSVRLKKLIRELDSSIDAIEKEIDRLVGSDETLKRQHELLLSIDGTGEKVAIKMIVTTNAFKDFDAGRQFCCHAVATSFKYDSGSNVRSRSRVSNRTDKSIKMLLHMATTRKKSGELRDYYIRKVGEEK